MEKPSLFNGSYTDKAVYLKYSEAPVYYMITMRGDAIEIHMGAEGRAGRLALRRAGKEIISWIPLTYRWCKMLLAPVSSKGVYNHCRNLGFDDIGEYEFEGGMGTLMGISYE